jgi:hypothetical protein
MTTQTKKSKLLTSLYNGSAYSIPQMRTRFGFSSENTVRGILSRFRSAGHPVRTAGINSKGRNVYAMGFSAAA